MRKENKNWVKLMDKSLLKFDTSVDMIEGTFGEKIDCANCNETMLPKEENWQVYLRKTRVYLDENGGSCIRTNIEFYCLDCDRK